MKKILILGASSIQYPVIEKCKRLGYYTIVADFNENAPGLEIADLPLIISTNDVEEVLKQAELNEIDGILTTSDFPVRTVAFVSEKMNLTSLSKYTAEVSTNKYLQREVLSKSGVNCPKFKLVSTAKDIESFIETYGYPIIIKPLNSSGSRGVSKISCIEEIEEALNLAFEFSSENKVIIEEFIGGDEYSVESLTQNKITKVIAITEKILSNNSEDSFVESRHIIPANVSRFEKQKIEEEILKTLNVIRLDNSAAHTEVKIFNDKAYIIEVGARLGGDFIGADLVSQSTGVDMLSNIIRLSLGEEINTDQTKNLFAGIQFIDFDNYNSAIKKIESLSNEGRIVRFEINDKPSAQSLKSSFDRAGYFICVADSRESLLDMLNVNI